jgi:hypothetical protein
MSDDSTRIKTHEKVVGLHYSEISTPAHCIDSAFTAKKPENRNFPGSVGKVGLAARSILKVLAAQYSTIGSEIASIGKSILAWHRSCEPSRRLEGVQIGAWSGGLDRAGAEATHDWRQGQARQHHQAG